MINAIKVKLILVIHNTSFWTECITRVTVSLPLRLVSPLLYDIRNKRIWRTTYIFGRSSLQHTSNARG